MIITLALRVSRALRSAFGAFALALNALWRCAAEPGPQRAAPLTVPDQRRTTAQELRAAPRPGHARPLAALLLIAGTLAAASAARAQLAPPGAGEVRALVIGIDHYATRRNLRGAVADARDVEQALRKGGVRDLTVLIDAEATRAQVLTAIDHLLTGAREGDLIFISFAGHGAQSPERIKGSDPDGVDEVFVLQRFDDHGTDTAERVLDKEINVWLKRIEKKGAYTLFLADTCHGGGLTRGVDLRAGELSYRQTAISIAPLDDALTPVSTDVDRMLQPEEFDRVTFLAAADKWTKAPELRIEGQATLRGALSYSVARALEGAASRSGDGKTTRRELFEYARQVVQQYSQSRQVIYTEPNRRTDLMDSVVFKRAGAAGQPQPSPAETRTEMTVRIAILKGSAADLAGVEPYAAKMELVGKDQQPDLVWDAAGGDVVSALGDIVARGIARHDIGDVIDRTAAVMAIAKLSEGRPQRIALLPDDKQHHRGETITFSAEDVQDKWIILFNIASDGTVQFLFPKKSDKVPSDTATLKLPDIIVGSPFGADHVVAIVSARRLVGLEDAVKAFDNVRAAGRMPGLLRKYVSNDQSTRIGFAGLFTAP